MLALASLEDYLAKCVGGSDTFEFLTEHEAVAFESILKNRVRDTTGRSSVVLERTGAKVMAWLPTARKRRAAR